MMMNSSSFESPKSYLFGLYLKKQQFSTFKVRNLVLKSANLLHKRGFDDSQASTTVAMPPVTINVLVRLQHQGISLHATAAAHIVDRVLKDTWHCVLW